MTKTAKALWRAAAVLLLTGGALAAYAFWWEPSSIAVVRHPIRLGPDAAAYNGLRLAVIADLHAGSLYIDAKKIDRIVALTNAAKPDMILLAGDYVTTGPRGNHRRMPLEEIAPRLAKLKAPLGVYALIGNHDRWDGAAHAMATLKAAGLTVLENDARHMRFRGQAMAIVGIGDFYTHASDIPKAFANIPAGQSALCFTHSPDIFPALPQRCVLTVTGHTHGGQVALPFLGRPIIPSAYGQRFAAGLIQEANKSLFVSTGIGTVGPPIRFGTPPEISLLELNSHG